MRIEQINPRNRPALAAWHATVVAGDGFGRQELATPWRLEEVVANLAAQGDEFKGVYAGIDDQNRVVVAGEIVVPLLHTPDQAEVRVYTHPEHRCRGFGSKMLAHLEVVARGHGRTVLNAETTWPYDAPADGSGTPNADFLTRRGFTFGLGDVAQLLDLPVDDALLADLAAEAAPYHAAYALRSWVGPVPDDLVQGYVDLTSRLMVEAPTGGLEREVETVSVEAFRRREDVIAAQGRTKYATVAISPEGEVVAYTDIVTSGHDPDNAYQWGTLVRREHRGHRLGLAVKVANQRLLQQAQDRAVRLRTWNAESNTHMVAVNQRLGFRPVERLGEFQRKL